MNDKEHLVGKTLTYADILLAHITTWFVEELGPNILNDTPLLLQLQIKIISLPSIKIFIRSKNYFPVGDASYCAQVDKVLDRK